jgi:hypothetical protein
MPIDHIRYDLLTREALRSVVRRVLADAAKNGLPGEHHFYVTFDTRAGGVRIAPRLREEYPEAMTIVLQHQFYDLEVGDTGFSVGLSFGGAVERLVVPFEAITGFADPSVQFGLQFETLAEAAEAEGDEKPGVVAPVAEAKPARTRKVPAADKSAPARPEALRAVPAKPEPAKPELVKPEPVKPDPDKPAGGAEVVRLDRFRKK